MRLSELLVNAYLIVYLPSYPVIQADGDRSVLMDEGQQAPAPQQAKKDRSPSFPFIPLTKAVERVREIYAAARRHEVRLPDAAKAMNYGAKSSGAIQTLAALIAYGLLDDEGSGETRKFRVTDLAFKILEDERPGAREAALAHAAKSPKLIAEYALVWRDGRPSDSICISELRIDRGFSEDGAKLFLRVFDDAMAYATGIGSDKESDNAESEDELLTPPKEFAIGDWVSVAAGGQLIYERTRVRAINPPWVFVEASQAGAKMDDVTLLERGSKTTEQPPVLPFAPVDEKAAQGEDMDRFTVDEGVVKITFPSEMTVDSVEELEQFFSLFIKKAKRRAGAPKATD